MGDLRNMGSSGFGGTSSPYADFMAERAIQQRLQLLSRNLPALTSSPESMWGFASDFSMNDQQMMRSAIGAVGQLAVGTQIASLREMDPMQQRVQYNLLDPEMQAALKQAGYNPPPEPHSDNGLSGTSWLRRLGNFVAPGDPLGKSGNLGLDSLGGIGMVATEGWQAIGNTVGFTVGTFLEGANSFKRNLDHVYRAGSAAWDRGYWGLWSNEIWQQTSDGEEYVHETYIGRAAEVLGNKQAKEGFFGEYSGTLTEVSGKLWVARKIAGGHQLLDIAKDAGLIEGTPEFNRFVDEAFILMHDPTFQEAVSILNDGKSSPGRDYLRGFSPDMPGYGWFYDGPIGRQKIPGGSVLGGVPIIGEALEHMSLGQMLSGVGDAAWTWYSDPFDRGTDVLKVYRAGRISANLNDVERASRISEAIAKGEDTYEFSGGTHTISRMDRHYIGQIDTSNRMIAETFREWDYRRHIYRFQNMSREEFLERMDQLTLREGMEKSSAEWLWPFRELDEGERARALAMGTTDEYPWIDTVREAVRAGLIKENGDWTKVIETDKSTSWKIFSRHRGYSIDQMRAFQEAKDVWVYLKQHDIEYKGQFSLSDVYDDLTTRVPLLTEAEVNRPIASFHRARPTLVPAWESMLRRHLDQYSDDLDDEYGVWQYWKTNAATEAIFRNPGMSRLNPDKMTLPSLTRLEARAAKGRLKAFEGGRLGLLGDRKFLDAEDLTTTVEEIEKTTVQYMMRIVGLTEKHQLDEAARVAKEFRDIAGTWHSTPRLRGPARLLRGFLRHVPRRGLLSLSGEDAITEANRVFDLAYALDVPEQVIDQFRGAFAVGSVAERNEIMARFFTVMVGVGGLAQGDAAAKLFNDFIRKVRQAYSLNEGDDTFQIIKGVDSKAAFIPNETDDVLMLPDVREFLKMTNQTSIIRRMGEFLPTSIFDNAMRKFWVPAQLIRIGFIPRAAGEEMLSYMLRRSPKDYVAAHIAMRATGLKQTKRLELLDAGNAKLVGARGDLHVATVQLNDATREMMLMRPILAVTHWTREFMGMTDYGLRSKAVAQLRRRKVDLDDLKNTSLEEYNRAITSTMEQIRTGVSSSRRGRMITGIDEFAWNLSNRGANAIHKIAEHSRFMDSEHISRMFLEHGPDDVRVRAARYMLLNPMGQRAFARMAAEAWAPYRNLAQVDGSFGVIDDYSGTGEMEELVLRLDPSNMEGVSPTQQGPFPYDPKRWEWAMAALFTRYAEDPIAGPMLDEMMNFFGDGVLAEIGEYADLWGLRQGGTTTMPGITDNMVVQLSEEALMGTDEAPGMLRQMQAIDDEIAATRQKLHFLHGEPIRNPRGVPEGYRPTFARPVYLGAPSSANYEVLPDGSLRVHFSDESMIDRDARTIRMNYSVRSAQRAAALGNPNTVIGGIFFELDEDVLEGLDLYLFRMGSDIGDEASRWDSLDGYFRVGEEVMYEGVDEGIIIPAGAWRGYWFGQSVDEAEQLLQSRMDEILDEMASIGVLPDDQLVNKYFHGLNDYDRHIQEQHVNRQSLLEEDELSELGRWEFDPDRPASFRDITNFPHLFIAERELVARILQNPNDEYWDLVLGRQWIKSLMENAVSPYSPRPEIMRAMITNLPQNATIQDYITLFGEMDITTQSLLARLQSREVNIPLLTYDAQLPVENIPGIQRVGAMDVSIHAVDEDANFVTDYEFNVGGLNPEDLSQELYQLGNKKAQLADEIDAKLDEIQRMAQPTIHEVPPESTLEFAKSVRRIYSSLPEFVRADLERWAITHDRTFLHQAYDAMNPTQRAYYTPLLRGDSASSRLISLFTSPHIDGAKLTDDATELALRMEKAGFAAMFAPGMTEKRAEMMRYLRDHKKQKVARPPRPGTSRMFLPTVHPVLNMVYADFINSADPTAFTNFLRRVIRNLPLEERAPLERWLEMGMRQVSGGRDTLQDVVADGGIPDWLEAVRNGTRVATGRSMPLVLSIFGTTNPRSARLISRALNDTLSQMMRTTTDEGLQIQNTRYAVNGYGGIGYLDLEDAFIKDPVMRSAVAFPGNADLESAGFVPLLPGMESKVEILSERDEVPMVLVRFKKTGEIRWVDASENVPEFAESQSRVAQAARDKLNEARERIQAKQDEFDALEARIADASWSDQLDEITDEEWEWATALEREVYDLKEEYEVLKVRTDRILKLGTPTLVDQLGDSVEVLARTVASGVTEESGARMLANQIRARLEESLTTFKNVDVQANDVLNEQITALINLRNPVKVQDGLAFNSHRLLTDTPLSHLSPKAYAPKLVTEKETGWSRFVRHWFDGGVSPAMEGLIRHPFFVDMLSKALDQGKFILDNYLRSLDNLSAKRRMFAETDEPVMTLRQWNTAFGDRIGLDDQFWDDLTEFAWFHADEPAESIDASDALVDLALALKAKGVQDNPEAMRRAVEDAKDALERYLDGPIEFDQNDFENLSKSVKIQANAKQQYIEASMQRATNLVTPFIDDHRIRSQWQSHVGTMVPFWFAEEQFLKRWARGLYENPAMLRKGQLYVHGMRELGVIKEDDEGNEMFIYPGSEYVMGAIGNTVGAVFGQEWKTVLSNPLTARVEYMLPGISPEVGRFQFGPLAAMPLAFLGHRFPEMAGPVENLLGESGMSRMGIGQSGNQSVVDMVWDNLMPAVARNALDVVSNNREGQASSILQAMQLLAAEGYLPTEGNEIEMEAYLERVRNIARVIQMTRTLSGFTLGASATPRLGEAIELNEDFQELLDTGMPFDEAVASFIAVHPDASAFTIFRSRTESGAPIPATEDAFNWMTENDQFIRSYNMIAPWFLPQGKSEEYGMKERRARNQALAYGLRVNKSDEEILRQIYWAEAAETYFAMNDEFESQIAMARATGDTMLSAQLQDRQSIWKQGYLEQHPVFAADLQQGKGRARRDEMVRQAREVLADEAVIPDFPHKEEMIQMLRLMLAWDDQMTSVQGITTGPAIMFREQVTTEFYNAARLIAEKYPSLKVFFNSQIRPLIGSDNVTELETVGRLV